MSSKKYIGLTGFTEKNAQNILRHFQKIIPIEEDLLFMCGVLVSKKTLRGEANNYSYKYPLVQDIEKIFTMTKQVPNTFNVIHFSSSDDVELHFYLRELVKYGGKDLEGIQLNIPWPAPQILESFRKEHRSIKIILQIGSEAIRHNRNNPRKIWEMVNDYNGCIDYILLDMSGGRGLRMDIELMGKFLEYMYPRRGSLRINIAGGIDHIFLTEIKSILRQFDEVGWDAEGRLWKGVSMDFYKVRMYLNKAFKLCSRELPVP